MGTAESKSESSPGGGAFDPSQVYVAPKVDIPLDENDERYVKSFSVDQVAEFTDFFKEYGFVVVRDVLTSEECQSSVNDIWQFLELRKYKLREWYGPTDEELQRDRANPPARIDRNDESTWNNDWPPLEQVGILGYLPVFTEQALLNRQNPNVYTVFSNVMGRKDLIVSHDRYGMFRHVHNSNGEAKNELWKTSYSLHWDLNPWRATQDSQAIRKAISQSEAKLSALTYSEPSDFFIENADIRRDQAGIQGLINLKDNLVEDGGFQLVVGGHKHLTRWAESTKHSLGLKMLSLDLVPVREDDPLYSQAQRVSMRAGSLVVWHPNTAHGSAPNSSSRLRMCQFLRMSPALDGSSDRAKHRATVIRRKVEASNVHLSELGRKLFGLINWS